VGTKKPLKDQPSVRGADAVEATTSRNPMRSVSSPPAPEAEAVLLEKNQPLDISHRRKHVPHDGAKRLAANTDQGKPTGPKDVDGQLALPKAHKPSIRQKVREAIDDSDEPPKIKKNQQMQYSNKTPPDDKKPEQHTDEESEDGCCSKVFDCALGILCSPLYRLCGHPGLGHL
jgi:hypothetical protein